MRARHAMDDEQIRAFIAIELPDRVRLAIQREADRLHAALGDRALRWVRPEAIHLTLRFLGEVPRSAVDQVAKALGPICARCPPLEIEVGGLGRFPGGAKPRVVWIGVKEEQGQLVALQSEIERAMVELGFRREDRPFHPHLTLARVRRETPSHKLRELAEQVDREQVESVGNLLAGHVALMRSQLVPHGASYHRLQQFVLTGTA